MGSPEGLFHRGTLAREFHVGAFGFSEGWPAIAYQSDREGDGAIFVQSLDG
jgi:hypothetical protein